MPCGPPEFGGLRAGSELACSARASGHLDEYGLAEYLAAGPELLNDWENAWEAGHPRAAALIMAVVDVRRAGLTQPLPRSLLESLHDDYLARHGRHRLDLESLDEAWATRPRRATMRRSGLGAGSMPEVFVLVMRGWFSCRARSG